MDISSTIATISPTTTNASVVFENGTIIGAVTITESTNNNSTNMSQHNEIIPEIVISGSSNSLVLNQSSSRCDIGNNSAKTTNIEEIVAEESTALLETQTEEDGDDVVAVNADAAMLQQHDEFEQFVLNRTTSDSNILESSIYSELQFPPSIGIGSGGGSDSCGGGGYNSSSGSGGSTVAATQTAPSNATATTATTTVIDLLNSSTCSRESRQSKRTRRKLKSKSKCNAAAAAATHQRSTPVLGTSYPPQYTAIFLEPHHHQIASAAAASPFLNAPATVGAADAATTYLQQQYHQYYQQRPLMSSLSALGHHHHHRSLLDPALPHPDVINANSGSSAGSSTINTTASAINPPLRISFRKWFSRPSLPFVIGILALGGVACTLGGIVLGSTGLIEHSTQYLSAALLMIGIGVSLLVISGAIWRLSLPDDVDECPCYRHMETCRNCNSPYCNNRLLPGSYLYPEFQHRPPPPSYLTSLNECAAMGLLFHPAAQAQQAAAAAAYSTLRMNTPPPLYRSTNSLSVFVPGMNTAAIPPNTTSTTTTANTLNIVPAALVMENLQMQTQPMAKEINYLELD